MAPRGLRPRLTLVATSLVALVSGLLLWLGWLLVGGVARGVPALPPGGTVRVGARDVPAEQVGQAVGAAARAEILRAGLIAFPLVVVTAAVLSWWLVGRVLGPLYAVTATARALTADSLDTRTGVRGARGEVAELAAGLDAMLDRLQAAFDAQRRFVANASHELRTPLAVLRTEVDVTLADPTVDEAELRRMGAVVRTATHRADALIDGLLLLARTEALVPGRITEPHPVDLAALVGPAVSAVRVEAEGFGLRVQVEGGPAPVSGDPALLERVAGNLVENAVRHNVLGGWVQVSTTVRDDVSEGLSAQLSVASTGPEVAPDQVEELFEPFRRGARERIGGPSGSGLGLSIVRAVVRAHAGSVHAQAVPGGGLAVTVRIPARPAAPQPG